MYSLTNRTRALIGIGAVAVLVACDANRDAVGLTNLNSDDLPQLRRHRQQHHRRLAERRNQRLHPAAGLSAPARRSRWARRTSTRPSSPPGCPAPVDNFQTQARVGGAAAPPCALRVRGFGHGRPEQRRRPRRPRAGSDLAHHRRLERAHDLHPRWQDAGPARARCAPHLRHDLDRCEQRAAGGLYGHSHAHAGRVRTASSAPRPSSRRATTPMIKQLLDSMPGLKGVLIGVPDASAIPLMSSGALIASSPQIQGAMAADRRQAGRGGSELRRFRGTRHHAAAAQPDQGGIASTAASRVRRAPTPPTPSATSSSSIPRKEPSSPGSSPDSTPTSRARRTRSASATGIRTPR